MIARPPITIKKRTKRCILDIRATTHTTNKTAANIHNAIKVLIGNNPTDKPRQAHF